MPDGSSEQGDIIASYDGEMMRQLLLGRFGLGGWDQVPVARGTLELTTRGVRATQRGWVAWIADPQPWTCRYNEIKRAEAIWFGALLTGFCARSRCRVGVRIDRGPSLTRLVFLTEQASEVLTVCERMGAPVEMAPKKLSPVLFGRR